MDLNLASLVTAFLCLDHPIVINTIAIILIKGCSFLRHNSAKINAKNKGEIKIPFHSTEDLNRILEILEII